MSGPSIQATVSGASSKGTLLSAQGKTKSFGAPRVRALAPADFAAGNAPQVRDDSAHYGLLQGRRHRVHRAGFSDLGRKSLTLDNQPKRGTLLAAKQPFDQPNGEFSGDDVTNLVRGWLQNPASNLGISVEGDLKFYAAFHADDNAEKLPRLVLEMEK